MTVRSGTASGGCQTEVRVDAMTSVISQSQALKLSICIATFNRANFIGATLDSMLSQTTDDCEIVILDGGSADNTESVVQEYSKRSDRLRYFRQDTNNGVDRDYDRAVELAAGEYCWLMTDDDLLMPGAIEAVLRALRQDLSLIIVNAEMRDLNMTKVIQPRTIHIESDRVYKPSDMDALFVDVRDVLMYIGGFVIKRSIWLARERERYYGSWFISTAVVFQDRLPGDSLVIAEPFIGYRMGNSHTFSPTMFETLMLNWPSLVWSFNLSESAKRKICRAEPWRSFSELLLWRGWGFYSVAEYRKYVQPKVHSDPEKMVPRLIAFLPGTIANAVMLLYYSITGRPWRVYEAGVVLQMLRQSPFYLLRWRRKHVGPGERGEHVPSA